MGKGSESNRLLGAPLGVKMTQVSRPKTMIRFRRCESCESC